MPAAAAASPATASEPINAAPCVPMNPSTASPAPLMVSQVFSPKLKFELSPSSTNLSTASTRAFKPLYFFAASLISVIPAFSSITAKTNPKPCFKYSFIASLSPRCLASWNF